jgi:hypothetical protein
MRCNVKRWRWNLRPQATCRSLKYGARSPEVRQDDAGLGNISSESNGLSEGFRLERVARRPPREASSAVRCDSSLTRE